MSKKVIGLTNLFEAKIFCIYKKTKNIIIYKNKNFIFIIFDIITLNLKYFNNAKKFVISSFVLSFYKTHLLKKENIRYY